MVEDQSRLQQLYRELADVEKEQREVNFRLKEMAPGNLRRNMAVPGGGGLPIRRESGPIADGRTGPSGHGMGAPRSGMRDFRDHGTQRQRPVFGGRAERHIPSQGMEGRGRPGVHRPAMQDEDMPRKRLASAVVVADEAVSVVQAEKGMNEHALDDRYNPNEAEARPMPGIGKRPAPTDLEERPDVKKRNRRMFGALLGTLQQFRKEDAKFKQSDAAAKREEALKKAEAKVEETTRVLRTKQREDHMAKKQAEIEKKKMLIFRGDRMRAEINYHRRVQHRQKLSKFIFTKAEPPLLWLPKQHNHDTEEILSNQAAGLNAWIKDEERKMQEEQAGLDVRIAELEESMKSREKMMESKTAEGDEVKTIDEPMGGNGEGEVPHGNASADNSKAESPQEEENDGDHEELDEHTDPEEFDDLLS